MSESNPWLAGYQVDAKVNLASDAVNDNAAPLNTRDRMAAFRKKMADVHLSNLKQHRVSAQVQGLDQCRSELAKLNQTKLSSEWKNQRLTFLDRGTIRNQLALCKKS